MIAFFALPLISFVVVMFVVPSTTHAAQTVPYLMNFQGRLTDASGNPVADGLYNMKFALYDAATSGTLKWGETRESTSRVQVTNGLFSTRLGEGTNTFGGSLGTVIPANMTLYLDITEATPATANCSTVACATWESPLTPRSQLVTSAYAFNADTVDGIDGASLAQLASNNAFTGTNSINVSNASAFSVVSGATNLFKVNTSGSQVVVGASDTTGAVLVLDVKTDAGDPSGTIGAMYYNSNAGKFRCYQVSAWVDCIAAGASPTPQNIYDNDSSGVADITTSSAAKTFLYKAGATYDSPTLFDIQDAAGSNLFVVDSTNDRVYIGAPSADNVGAVLVLDTKNTSTDPTGVDGAMYYNSVLKKFRCYEGSIWKDCTNSILDAASGYRFMSDLTGSPTTTGQELFATNSTGSTAAGTNIATNRPGVLRTTTAASATGRSAYSTGLGALSLGSGASVYETAVNVTTLSTGTERFQLVVGFFDTATAANQVDAVAFVYDEGGVSTGSTASAAWQTATVSNSTRTWNTSNSLATTVSAGTWVKLRIEVNAAGTSANFLVNGTSIATHTANIPTGTTRALGFGWLMIKSIGTTARTTDVDYLKVEQDFTTAR